MALHPHKKAPNTADESGHGSHTGSTPDGGTPAPTGDGANVKYPDMDGTAEPAAGGMNPAKDDKSGLDVSIGKG